MKKAREALACTFSCCLFIAAIGAICLGMTAG
jgi:hypothetical protein